MSSVSLCSDGGNPKSDALPGLGAKYGQFFKKMSRAGEIVVAAAMITQTDPEPAKVNGRQIRRRCFADIRRTAGRWSESLRRETLKGR